MNITINQSTTTEPVKVSHAKTHRELSREWARRKYYAGRVEKWQEALEYMLSLNGDIPELAEQMAKKYRIGKIKY